MMAFEKIKEYWNINPPVILKHPKNWNGVTITPLHNERKVLMPRYDSDFVSITPIHEETKSQTITRSFGDLLSEEVA